MIVVVRGAKGDWPRAPMQNESASMAAIKIWFSVAYIMTLLQGVMNGAQCMES